MGVIQDLWTSLILWLNKVWTKVSAIFINHDSAEKKIPLYNILFDSLWLIVIIGGLVMIYLYYESHRR